MTARCLLCRTPTGGDRLCAWCGGWGRLRRSGRDFGGQMWDNRGKENGPRTVLVAPFTQGPRRTTKEFD